MATDTLSYDLQKTIRLLPGYDPFAQAGDCWFDEDAARMVLAFVQECCTHVKGELAGQTIRLEPWQQSLFANLYGWKRLDGTRRYREAMVFVPRKNSKTTMAACIVNIGLFLEDEPGAELYSAAAEREQARLCFEIVTGMIRNEPEMERRAELYKYSIVVGDTSYKALSAEAGSKHGFNVQLVVNDELHAHKTAALTEVLMTGQGSRRQPLTVHLTTSDYEREGSICNQKHDYACRVRDGVIDDPSFLPVIYEATREDDWTDPVVWRKANPNLAVSISEEYLAHECGRAKNDPAYENTFKRLHFNIRTEHAFRLIQMDQWDACNAAPEIPDGAACCAGLDLASTTDMAALVLCHHDGERYHLLPFFWAPEAQVRELESRGRREYANWVRAGMLTATPGNSIDYQAIRAKLKDLATQYKITEVAYDPWNATQLAGELGSTDGLPMVEHRQGTVSMNEPMKLLIAQVLDGKINHGGHPVLRWNASNLAARADTSGNMRPDKAASTGKIDGMVAAVMAMGRASVAPAPRESFYENHGVEMM